MDLATLAPVDASGTVMEVRHPTTDAPLLDDKGKPITITLVGADSDQFRRVQRHFANQRLKANRKSVLTAEMLEDQAIETLAACTIAWSGIVLEKPLECSADNARKVYSHLPWLREQVDTFIADRANFLPN